MTIDISRRAVLGSLVIGTTGLLCKHRFAYAETRESPTRGQIPIGKPGIELSIFAMDDRTLRFTVAAIDEILDNTYADGSLTSRPSPLPLLQGFLRRLQLQRYLRSSHPCR